MSAAASSEWIALPEEDPQVVLEAVHQAVAQSLPMKKEIDGSEVLIPLGGTGSGKSTFIGLLNGHEYEVQKGKVAPKPGFQGFETGLEGGVARTKRAEWRKLPGSDVFAVDLPGWDDDTGLKGDLVTSVWYNAVVEAAATVRPVYVQSAVKFDITNDRQVRALAGLEAVAGCFEEPSQWVGSVAFIITQGKARDLQHWAPTLIEDVANSIQGEQGLLEGVRRKACQGDEASIRVLPYLERIAEYCSLSIQASESVTNGDFEELLQRHRASNLFLWPVNPLEPRQAQPLRELLLALPPVPRSAMSRRLPKGTLLQLERLIANVIYQLRSKVHEIDWAADPALLEKGVDAAFFMSTVMRLEWTEDASRHPADLASIFVMQNKFAVTVLTGAISRVEVESFNRAKAALEQQQVFYKSASKMIPFRGWKSPVKAAEEAAATLRAAVAKEVPANLATALWDELRCRRMEFFMKIAAELGDVAQEVPRDFQMKVEGLLSHLHTTVRALELPEAVQGALEKLGSLLQLQSALPELDFESSLASAKACFLDELKSLSQRLVAVLRQSPLSATEESSKLRRFCSSQRLCTLVGENLAQKILTDTLSGLVPTTEEQSAWLQPLAGRSEPDKLEPLVRAVQRAVMLKAMEEDDPDCSPEWVQPFLQTVGPKIHDSAKAAEEVIVRIVARLGSSRRGNLSSYGDEDESSEEYTQQSEDERVESELRWLSALLVLDKHLDVPIASIFMKALHNLEDCLKRLTKKIRRDPETASALSSKASLEAAVQTRRCLGQAAALVSHALEGICLDEEHMYLNTQLEIIKNRCLEEQNRVAAFLNSHLEPLRTLNATETLKQNRSDTLHEAFARLRLLQPLRPLEVGEVEEQLQTAVMEWYKELLKEARDLLCRADQEGSWKDFVDKAVENGLAFEQGPCFQLLCERGLLKSNFQDLVTDAGSSLVRRAAVARSGAGVKGLGECWEALQTLRESLSGVWRGSDLFKLVDQELDA